MFEFFKKSSKPQKLPFLVDIHSHLLPGIDDGVKSIEETIYIINILKKLGYRKVITTPHVMSDHYPNTTEEILVKAGQVSSALKKQGVEIDFEAAAEYYLDEEFSGKLKSGSRLLTFQKNHLLFETSFINKPAFLEEAVFEMNSNGYQPVLAHPERYIYLQNNQQLIEQLKNMNVLFQVNMLSFLGYYSPEIKRNAMKLLKQNLIDFVGTDCHSALQADEIWKFATKRRKNVLSKIQCDNHLLR